MEDDGTSSRCTQTREGHGQAREIERERGKARCGGGPKTDRVGRREDKHEGCNHAGMHALQAERPENDEEQGRDRDAEHDAARDVERHVRAEGAVHTGEIERSDRSTAGTQQHIGVVQEAISESEETQVAAVDLVLGSVRPVVEDETPVQDVQPVDREPHQRRE